MVYGTGTADCTDAGADKLNGELNSKGGPNISGVGASKELLVGDCMSTKGNAPGAAADRPIINGGDGNDILVGDGYAPNGVVSGKGSDNNMLGGAGNDQIFGDHHPSANQSSGGGNDHTRGGRGNDQLEGGPATDTCSGGPGQDRFTKNGSEACEETTGNP